MPFEVNTDGVSSLGKPIFLFLFTLNALPLLVAVLVITMVFGGVNWFRPRLRFFFPSRVPDGRWARMGWLKLYAGMIFRIFEYQLIRIDARS